MNDVDDGPATLNVVPLSDNPTLIPPGGLVLSGQGSRRQLTVTPVSGQTGDARDGDNDEFAGDYGKFGFQDMHTFGVSGNFKWDFREGLKLTSITDYSQV